MLPFGQSQPGGSLEDRLRGMILNNQATTRNGSELPTSAPTQVPPHLHGASEEAQARYFAAVEARKSAQTTSQPATTAPKQKRPNQAQRRQMTAQMSIPIDSRSQQNSQAGRSPSFNGYSTSPHYNSGSHNQRSHGQAYSPRYQNSQHSPRQSLPQSSPSYHQNARALSYPEPGPQFSPSPSHSNFRPNLHQVADFPPNNYAQRPVPQNRQLYQPSPRGRQFETLENHDISTQVSYLETILNDILPSAGITEQEKSEKDIFRSTIEKVCQETITLFERSNGNPQFDSSSVQLRCFGSMASGFATQASDMDLALLAPQCVPDPHSPESRIPRLLEKELLNRGFGARLLTRTRVPIIKLCEKPSQKLLADLREERVKWDHGIEDDIEDGIPELADSSKPGKEQKKRDSNDIDPNNVPQMKFEVAAGTNIGSQSPLTPSNPPLLEMAGDIYDAKLSGLKQQGHQNLQDYHNSAKRLLRKLGGRDITANAPLLSDQEAKILIDVCKAFILGLDDVHLKERLRQYPSLAPLFESSYQGKIRSLQGLWTQAEGERLAMAFPSRLFVESSERAETEAESAVESWAFLQAKPLEALDSIQFNRQLFAAFERLKKINSLQVIYFEQMPYEDPIAYYARAQKIQLGLRPRKDNINQDSMTEVATYIVQKYTSGVNLQSAEELASHKQLRDVNREHVRLQLIQDYEHALSLSIYDSVDATIVKEYVESLKINEVGGLDISNDLIMKVKKLPDPTLVSTLKPRDPYKDKLEFPKTDIGIQCDINFSAHLAIHNTLLLQCYAASDARVKPMILFVKSWAKLRGINTAYRGTLNSYGYVLMVLHYLVNIAQPFVCPNLQLVKRDPPEHWSPAEREARSVCEGRDVRFWRNESEIQKLADQGMLNHNKDSLGYLLRGFFEYFAHNGMMSTIHHRGFDWGREVLSLRCQGGIVSKQDKGWTGAKTVVETSTIAAPATPTKKLGDPQSMKTMEETKEIRYRYLFAIEDPFELDHNVARTVTHNGIVSIRDEFRRAWRIIKNVGRENKEGLLDPISDNERKHGLKESMDIMHGMRSNGESQLHDLASKS